MAFSIRFDAATERAGTRLARRRGQTKAAIIREALAAYEAGEKSPRRPERPAEVLAQFIGISDSGDSRRSANTGAAFRALVKKTRVHRPR
jgi:hypothetical protein